MPIPFLRENSVLLNHGIMMSSAVTTNSAVIFVLFRILRGVWMLNYVHFIGPQISNF